MRTCKKCKVEGIADDEVVRVDSNGDEVYGEQYDHGVPLCYDCIEQATNSGISGLIKLVEETA